MTETPTHANIAIFGEVLIDQFPDGQQVLGGAPFNVAWHLQAFGLAPTLISRIGHDATGADIQQAMHAWGLSTHALQIDPIHPTGTVAVSFKAGEPHYEILSEQAYDFIEVDNLALSTPYNIIYHGTLALRQSVSATTLNTLLAKSQRKVFIDVNLRTPWWELNTVQSYLKSAHWVKLNEDELIHLSAPQKSFKATLQAFLTDYELEVLIVTRGEKGAAALSQSGVFIEVTPTHQVTIVDTVGAGDAFAAVLLLGLNADWPLDLTLNRAQEFASATLTQQGATIQNPDFYQAFIDTCQLNVLSPSESH